MKFAAHLVVATVLCSMLVACERDEADDTAPEEADEPEETQQAEPDNEPEPDEEPDQPQDLHPIWGDWAPESDLEALQGQWVNRGGPGDEVVARWDIDGNEAVLERRGETREGTIEIPHPGAVEFSREVEGGGTTGRTFSFARQGETLYLGRGMGGVVLDDRVVLRDGRSLVVYRDGECTYHEEDMFDGFDEEGTSIECGTEERDDREFFVFSEPDDGTEYSPDQGIVIGEEAITDRQLRGNELERPQ